MIASDKTGFAIQITLHSIAHLEIPDEDHSQAAKTSLPSRLREMLGRRMILDVVEPFWYTRYRIQGAIPSMRSPIFRPGMQFQQWISAWVKTLVCHGGGVASRVFDCCKAILKHRNELSQFVLPHVVANYLLCKSRYKAGSSSSSSSSSGTLKCNYDDILWEVCCVLRGMGDISSYSRIADLVPATDEFACAAALEGEDMGGLFVGQGPGSAQSDRAVSRSRCWPQEQEQEQEWWQ